MSLEKNWLLLLPLLLLLGCQRVEDTAKGALHEGSRKAGRAAGEVIEGVATGIEETFDVNLQVSDALKSQGVSTGQISIRNDSLGTDNVLSVYLIFDKKFNDTLLVKVFNENNQEKGRKTLPVSAVAGYAGYYDFSFDQRTDMDAKDRVELDILP